METHCSYSVVNGNHIQTIFNDGTAKLLIWRNGKYTLEENYEIGRGDIRLIPINQTYLEHGNVVVPSGISSENIEKLHLDLMQFYYRNVVINKETNEVLAGLCMYTWLFDRTQTAPYLYIYGDFGSGKSKLKDLLKLTCFNSTDLGTSVTEANIFRMQDTVRGTLFIDEFELYKSDQSNPMIQILNEGYKANGVVIRNESRNGRQYVPTPFAVFGPKVIASRSIPQDDAFMSRCFVIHTESVDRSVLEKYGIPLDITPKVAKEAEQLRNRLLAHRFSHYGKVPSINPNVRIKSQRPRDSQLIKSIISVLPYDYQPRVSKCFEASLFLKSITPDKEDEINVITAIDKIIKSIPQRILFKDISHEIEEIGGNSYTSKEIGNIIRRIGLDTKRLNQGTAVIINSESNFNKLLNKYGVESVDGELGEVK